jgi:hypothetical protein
MNIETDNLDPNLNREVVKVTPVQKEHYDAVELNGGAYKKHVRIRNYLSDIIGTSCRQLKNGEINYDEFMKMQIGAVKKCVRSYGLSITLRSWRELVVHLQQIPNRTLEGYLVLFQPMADTFTFNFNQPRVLYDTLPDRDDPEARLLKEHYKDNDPDGLLKFHTSGMPV